MNIDELLERLEWYKKTHGGETRIDLHVITNNPTLSKAPAKGAVIEASLEDGKIVRKIVLFGGSQYV